MRAGSMWKYVLGKINGSYVDNMTKLIIKKKKNLQT